LTDVIRHTLALLAEGSALSEAEAEAFMGAVLDGHVSPAQLGAALMGIRVRGETPAELAGLVRGLRSRALMVPAPEGTIDVCGTGGDGRHTFNISTAVAIVAAAAGVPVAKAGNRAVSSRSGSSDVMAALGLVVEQGVADAAASLREDGFAYLHAPAFHPGMRHAGPVRRELGVRTAFNLCGPLANPAMPRRQVVGVPDERAAQRVAEALLALGTERAWVVTGERIDELPLDGSGVALVVGDGRVERRAIDPGDAGLARASTGELGGGDPEANAAIIEGVLRGERRGPSRDVVVLNAAAALLVAGHVPDLATGAGRATDVLESGAAGERLDRLRERARSRAAAATAQGPGA
jgi:anthranilate phosphoribosyltransferase